MLGDWPGDFRHDAKYLVFSAMVGVLCLFCEVAFSHSVSEGLMIDMIHIKIFSK